MNRRALLAGAASLLPVPAWAFGRLGIEFGHLGRGGGGRLTSTAFNQKIGFFGDSITGNGLTGAATAPQYNENGFTTFTPIFASSLLTQPVGGNRGVFGDTTALMLARLSAINALGCSVVTVMGGTNDLAGSLTATTIAANLTSICSGLTAGKILLFTVLPRFSPNALTGPQETQRGLLNTSIRAMASSRISIVDCETLALTTADFGTGDGLHPNTSGTYKIGKLAGPLLAALQTGTTAQFDAMFTGNPNPNNGMVGTGGTLAGGATGSVANAYTLNSFAGGTTTVGSKSTGQVVTFGGAYTGSATTKTILQAFITPTMNTGETWEMFMEAQILANFSSNLFDLQLNMQIYDTSFGFLCQSLSFPGTAGLGMPLLTSDGVIRMRSPQVVIPAGNPPVNMGFNVNINIATGSAVITSGQLQVMNIAARKVK